ncbi:MAG TPA: hypothetical protein VFR32_08370 [Gaiellaceae bacterium]|nr:hypothetical protein [Gaiellaceae bacterium]
MKMATVDDGQVEELRRWAQGLSTDTRPEVKAAARAITMLADELEAARSQLLEERMIREALEARQADEEAAEMEHDLRTRLFQRLYRRA